MLDGRVLVVDNEPELLELVSLHLRSAGMEVCCAASGDEALQYIKDQPFDLIILDIMMDGMNGFEVLQQLRYLQLETPVILLSAKQEDESKVYGFGIGADDYVTKPFSPSELVARAQAHIRRKHKTHATPQSLNLTYGPFTLDPSSQLLFKHDVPIPLSAKETLLLRTLMKRPNQAIAKMELFAQVWGHQNYDENSLNVYINQLRRKIEDDPRQPKYIQTVWGVGYRFMRGTN